MRSVRRGAYRAGLLVAVALLLLGTASGCQTTQETAAAKRAEAKRILEKREKKRDRKHRAEHGGKGAGEQ